MKNYYFEAITAYLITLEDDPNLQFIFFLYQRADGESWRVTSAVSDINDKGDNFVITTRNSIYTLNTERLINKTLKAEEFLFC